MNAYRMDEQVGAYGTAAVVMPARERQEQAVVRVFVLQEPVGGDATAARTETPMVVGQVEDSLENATWEDAAWY